MLLERTSATPIRLGMRSAIMQPRTAPMQQPRVMGPLPRQPKRAPVSQLKLRGVGVQAGWAVGELVHLRWPVQVQEHSSQIRALPVAGQRQLHKVHSSSIACSSTMTYSDNCS